MKNGQFMKSGGWFQTEKIVSLFISVLHYAYFILPIINYNLL